MPGFISSTDVSIERVEVVESTAYTELHEGPVTCHSRELQRYRNGVIAHEKALSLPESLY